MTSPNRISRVGEPEKFGRPAATPTRSPNHRFGENFLTWIASDAAEPVPYPLAGSESGDHDIMPMYLTGME
jgi:hypothetical protein